MNNMDEEKEIVEETIPKTHNERNAGRPKGSKNKKKKFDLIDSGEVTYDNLQLLEEGYSEKLDSDPKFSLAVDPENKYNLSEQHKKFIEYYVQFKNIPMASKLAGVENDTGLSYFTSYSTQQEIRRINLAMYHRQFNSKMLNINEIGGYLTSLITDTNVPVADRLSSKDKVGVAKMLVELNELKKQALENPQIIDAMDVEDDLHNLSVKSIKQLIENSYDVEENLNDKNVLISEIDKDKNLLPEEIAYLKTLSKEDLFNLLETINKKGEN